MVINDITEKKTNSISFISNTEEDEDQCDSKEILSDVIVFVGRKFNKALKKLDRRCGINFKDKVSDKFNTISPQCKNKEDDKPNKGKGIQCHESEGFGHIKA